MRRGSAVRRVFHYVLPGKSYLDDLDDELRFHLEMRAAALTREGMPPAEARSEARRRFGDLDSYRRECRRIDRKRDRTMRRIEIFSELWQDLTFAGRQLARSPGFALAALLTLALGLGATSAIFSAVHAVVLKPLPYPDPGRLMRVWEHSLWRGAESYGDVSAGNFTQWRRRSHSFSGLAATRYTSFNLGGGGEPERVRGLEVSADYFSVLGMRPLVGRTLLPEEDVPGHERVVVLSQGLWARRFASDPGAVGRDLEMNGARFTVVGVMPAAFNAADNPEQLWVPIAFTPERQAMFDEHTYLVVGRLGPGVSRQSAEAEIGAIAATVRETVAPPAEADQVREARLVPLAEDLVGDYPARLFVLLGAVGFVLLIACANVANLLLARGTARGRELAIRTALGARRGRLVRQLLTESLALSLAGGAAGLVLAFWGVRFLVALAPPGVPRLEQAGLDPPVVAFTCAAAVAAGILSGLAPALRVSIPDPQVGLREGGRGAAGSPSRDRTRSALVAVEVALALALLVGAGLLIRSSLLLARVAPGFDPGGVLTARLALPAEEYPEAAAVSATFARLVEEARALPGVAAAAVGNRVPFGGSGGSNGLFPEGRTFDPTQLIDGNFRLVSPDYFRALGIPLIAGRLFGAEDRRGGLKVMVVNETLARQAWPGEEPLGKRIACCEGTDDEPSWKVVVGVVGDVHSAGLGRPVPPTFYLPLGQEPAPAWTWLQRSMTLLVRTSGDPATLVAPLRRAVVRVDPGLPTFDVATMEERLGRSLAQQRFNTSLLALLGAIGLALAAVGIYGVIAYFVGQRTREIGVRVALGALPLEIVSLVLRHTLAPVAAGVVLGTGLAAAAARLLASQLYGVGAADPATFAAVALTLVAVALLAGYLPARRAARIDPTEALHEA